MERIMTPRHYIRHPSDVPIEIEPEYAPARERRTIVNIGYGGVAFDSPTALPRGRQVRLRITAVQPVFEAQARVAWCQRLHEHDLHEHDLDERYLVGVAFVTREDLYAARMVEQLCHIEHYKQEVFYTEGRALTGQQAALEWISKYADRFPSMDHGA